MESKCPECGAPKSHPDSRSFGSICIDAQIAAMDARIASLTAEVEDARIYITTEDGSKLHIRNLIRCGLRSLKKKRGVFWSNVADAYGVGSTSAHRLCRFVNLDPDTGELVDPPIRMEEPQ
jgi:hypothetical protein